MPEPLKNLYSPVFYQDFCQTLAPILPAFKEAKFMELLFDTTWEKRELKDRMKHTSKVLHGFMPQPFPASAETIKQLVAILQQQGKYRFGLEYMFLPDYIETYGLDHFEASVDAFEAVTQFTSCEFAVRPFIVKYGDRMMVTMTKWSLHEDHRVRRLASEGCRPRLPWAMALPAFKKDPSPILPILENLKTDPSEFVRRSVANNLNDITKDNPEIVLSILKKWEGLGKETEAVLKHACRSMLKQGHKEVLRYFKTEGSDLLEISAFEITTPSIRLGDYASFSFQLRNVDTSAKQVRLEYAVYYRKANGSLAKKVFKICEKELPAFHHSVVQRRQSFKPITTRVFYPGEHRLSIIVNGQEKEALSFYLETAK